jgi:hypothetical protein
MSEATIGKWISSTPSTLLLTSIDLDDDGTTEYSVEMSLDPDTDTIYMTLPNGVVVQATDAHTVSKTGNFAIWELYEFNADAPLTPPIPFEITAVWVEDADGYTWTKQVAPTTLQRLAGQARKSAIDQYRSERPRGISWSALTPGGAAIPTSSATMHTDFGLTVDFPDDTLALRVDVSVYVNISSGAQYLLLLPTVGASGGGSRFMVTGPYIGYVNATFVWSNLPNGGTYLMKPVHWVTGGSGGTWKAEGNMHATIVATPIIV